MPRVLLLLDQKANGRLLEAWLSEEYQVVDGLSSDSLAGAFDLAVLDGLSLQRISARAVQRRLTEAPMLLPFLLLTQRSSGTAIARYLGHVVDDLILTPIDKTELRTRVANLLRLRKVSVELHRQYEAVERLSVTDDVSGFHNTRFLHRHLDHLLTVPDGLVSLVFFDMDRFKSVVDTHGHLLAAKVLREVAQVVSQYLEEEDRIVRYGGDEYVVVLPGQDKGQALAKVERIKAGLASTAFLHEEAINLRVSASFGLATYPHDANDKRALLAEADRCLFRSKEAGKNCITTASRPNQGQSLPSLVRQSA